MHTDTSLRTVAAPLTALDPIDVEFLPWRPVPGRPGVRTKELWRAAESVFAMVVCDPDASTAGPPHPLVEHHIWVTEGTAIVAGRRLSAGSYVHVPPDTEHPVTGGEHLRPVSVAWITGKGGMGHLGRSWRDGAHGRWWS